MMKTRTTVLLAALALTISLEMAAPACAQGLFAPGEPIRPLDSLWEMNSSTQLVPAQYEVVQAGSPGANGGENSPSPRSMTDVAASPHFNLQRQREELKHTLATGGQSASEQRDDLTSEVFNVVQWTSAILILGTLAAFGLKKFDRNRWTAPVAASAMRILETVPLGRTGGLHLVAVGEERLVVAADNTGIKSVTLLPSWSAEEESPAEPGPRNPPATPVARSPFSKQLAALGGKPPSDQHS